MGGDNYTMGPVVNQDAQPTSPGAPSPWGGGSIPENPYTAQYGQDVSAMYPQAMASQGRMNTLNSQASAYGAGPFSGGNNQPSQQNNSSSYPAYPNSFGLGNTAAFSVGQGQQAAPQSFAPQQPTEQQPVDQSSRGFNPWSLTGEANSRESF